MSQVSNWQTVQNPVAGNLVTVDTFLPVHSDLGQPYDDLASLRYGTSQSCVFFQFNLRGKIPLLTESAPVQSIWYQVLIAVSQSSASRFQWSNSFAPDHILDWEVAYLPGNEPYFAVLRYSGSGNDWKWTAIGETEQTGANVTLQGGIGLDFFVLASPYRDLGATPQSTLDFFARTGIRLSNGSAYNDYLPSSGLLSTIPVPESPSAAFLLISALLLGTCVFRRKKITT